MEINLAIQKQLIAVEEEYIQVEQIDYMPEGIELSLNYSSHTVHPSNIKYIIIRWHAHTSYTHTWPHYGITTFVTSI